MMAALTAVQWVVEMVGRMAGLKVVHSVVSTVDKTAASKAEQ
jgi:hypothetical protein